MTSPDKLSDTSQKWQQFERHDYGFAISYPVNWQIEYPGEEFVLIPSHIPLVFDPLLGRKVPSPAVSIKKVFCKNDSENIVTTFAGARPNGYEGYSFVKTYPHTVTGARYEMAYEFQFGLPAFRFTVLSVLVQRKIEMFNITAQASNDDFERERDTLQRIAFSFHLIPGYAELPYYSDWK
jgi:hypothetical protein